MSLELANSTVVIAARQFNPTITREYWLVRHGVLGPEEVQQGSVFTDVIVQVNSPRFRLHITPAQFQFSPTVSPDEQQNLINDKVGVIVENLPHTPFTAIGLNFTWHLIPDESDSIEQLGRTLFYSDDHPLYHTLDSADARFGGYVSRNILGFRMKLDMKPSIRVNGEQRVDFMNLAFNFHLELPEDESVAAIVNAIQQWETVSNEAQRIANIANGET